MDEPEITEASEWKFRAIVFFITFVIYGVSGLIGCYTNYITLALGYFLIELSVLVGCFCLLASAAYWAEKENAKKG